MAFRFSLAAVLRLREIHEQREERLLTQMLAQVTQAREALVEIKSQIEQAVRSREAELSRSMSIAELHAAYGLVQLLRERREATTEQLRQFESLRDQQIRTYQAAHQAREVLSTMRTHQKESFRIEQGRREQSASDDIFMSRRSRE